MNLFHKDDTMKRAEAAKLLKAMMPKEALYECQERIFLDFCWDLEKKAWALLQTSEMTELWLDSKESIKDCVDRIAKRILEVKNKKEKAEIKFILNMLPLAQKILFECIEVKGGE